ncbi:SDR family mycofactocin-dependent oxidoreductase [Nocardia nova]|uniref:SDR family mycofactocin-dependent oxidoreductase n=1 Tax=Nocardia nova TaxID=37330 RepID=A0A2S6AQD2_9NOCA|nr:mycofactocin-coupled SDR family oxidoreductase [Nocardia nova]PPJ26620.1 SDR family mycofactocin-dependent oxidoreductase [Nocardia nova]PPJ37420.1 SDR family mycofactocin-dependent oxidoreductase [Nocardia nova]
MTGLEGKVALITGAARGQGRSHAVRLAGEGADIIALDICADIDTMDYPNATPEDLKETVAQVEALGRRIVATETDVRDAAATREAVDRGYETFGRLDIVLSNAGIVRLSDGPDDYAQMWRDVVSTNLSGGFHVVNAAVPHIISGGRGGSIVFTGSTAGVRPTASLNTAALAYTASKWGLVGICKQYAASLAEHSIRVNIVHPTGVASGMTMNEAMARLAQEAAAGGDNSISQMQNAMRIQILQPGDISDAIAFLVSDQAKWITGVSLPVDAGFSIR